MSIEPFSSADERDTGSDEKEILLTGLLRTTETAITGNGKGLPQSLRRSFSTMEDYIR